ncbi:MAG: thiol:disulfide interchange protein DsbA/DsbL [Woeseiaceae bacterium]
MKHLLILFVVLFALSACGKKEEPQEPAAADVPAAVEAPAETVDEGATPDAEAGQEETLQVVEESAAVEEADEDEAIVLAMADTAEAAREWKFKEGQHYERLVPTQPLVGSADKLEVAEVFQYTCPHCFTLDPTLTQWAEELDPDVRFVRIPAVFNRVAQVHAQMFYTAELLASNGTLEDFGQFHTAAFNEIHRRGNRLVSVDAIERLFARFGVSAEDFSKTWNSFPVNQKMRVGADLARRYNVASVPTIVVNGKYRVSNQANLTEIIDELLVREGLR